MQIFKSIEAAASRAFSNPQAADYLDLSDLCPPRSPSGATPCNRMLVLLKPECFRPLRGEDQTANVGRRQLAQILTDWGETLRLTGSSVQAACLFNGEHSKQHKLYGALYRTLEKVSEAGIKGLHPQALRRLAGLQSSGLEIWGGQEVLRLRPHWSAESLQEATDAARVQKLGANLYFSEIHGHKEFFGVLNGFSPYQRDHFEAASSILAACVVDTPLTWSAARDRLVGGIVPGNAPPGSLRRLLCDARLFGNPWDIAHNGAHISAGPLEAMAQIAALFPESRGRLLFCGPEELAAIVANPLVGSPPREQVPLFELTELMETADAKQLLDRCRKANAATSHAPRHHEVQ